MIFFNFWKIFFFCHMLPNLEVVELSTCRGMNYQVKAIFSYGFHSPQTCQWLCLQRTDLPFFLSSFISTALDCHRFSWSMQPWIYSIVSQLELKSCKLESDNVQILYKTCVYISTNINHIEISSNLQSHLFLGEVNSLY